ncbi:transmembrane and immunoglobulin domain-containing protein 2 isoform X2 [Gallus gallus]|uniref:transmembrane and immunoglobulin domain-containing protein 2 isoform X2 n=1 Tax=Gallus gallus TaxID=9031 RepID=UPI001AE265FE|nr:transmembrane and immunoglobulin domain-containing protein 2 isoform X2 [Gallus gallus]
MSREGAVGTAERTARGWGPHGAVGTASVWGCGGLGRSSPSSVPQPCGWTSGRLSCGWVVGANASLPCQLVPARPWSVVRIAWLKDGGSGALCTTRLRPEAAAVPCATPYLQLAWSPPHANLSLRGAQEGHAGCYVCHVTVEVPYLATAAGNGTALHVGAGADGAHGAGMCAPTAPHGPPPPAAGGDEAVAHPAVLAELPWKLGGAAGGSLLLVALISLCCWRRRRRADTPDVYVNIVSLRTPRNRSPQGAAAGGQRIQRGLDRAWEPPSPKG